MRAKAGWGAGLLGGVAASGLLLPAASASAAPAPTPAPANPDEEARIARLEAAVAALQARVERDATVEQENTELKGEVETLQAQVADLKASQVAEIREVRSAATAQPTVSLAKGRPTFTSADGKFSASLRTVVQFDAAHYDVNPDTAANTLGSGSNFRRARLGVDGKAFGDWNYSIWGEFGGSGGEAPGLNQAYIEYAGFHPFGKAATFRLRVGAWATPTGLEDATSNTDSLLLERPAVGEMVRGLSGGDGRTGFGGFLNGDKWYASAVVTGKVVGVPTVQEFDQQQGYLLRAAVDPFSGLDFDTHLGVNVQGIIRPADTAAGPAVTESIRLRERPELRVDGNRLVNTGAITADGLTAYGLEGGASWKSLYVAGEWYKIDVSRTAVGAAASPFDPSFSGWYVQGSWALTGERRVWSSANGGFRGPKVAKPLDLSNGQWGAWEVGLRYSVLNLNDRIGAPGAATPFGGINGGRQTITSAGLNWYPNSVIRFLLDYQWTQVNRLSSTGVQVGERERAVSLRSQFAF